MIGKATVAVVALVALLGIVATRVPSESAMLIVSAAGVAVILVYLIFLGFFAHYHPDLAATEGPTYVQSRQIALAAKNMPTLPVTDMVGDPQNPTLLSPGQNERGADE